MSQKKPEFIQLGKGVSVKVVDNPNDVVIFDTPIFRRMAVTVEGRRYQKLVGGVTHTADGRVIDNDGRVSEPLFKD